MLVPVWCTGETPHSEQCNRVKRGFFVPLSLWFTNLDSDARHDPDTMAVQAVQSILRCAAQFRYCTPLLLLSFASSV